MKPVEVVCVGLLILGGNSYLRISAICGGMSRSSAQKWIHIFTKAVITILKPEYLHLPTLQQLIQNEAYFRENYLLPGFGCAVDGVFFNFKTKPRKLPAGANPQNFFSRKKLNILTNE